MNYNFAQQINPYLESHNYASAAQMIEQRIAESTHRGFDNALGVDLTPQSHELALWIEDYYMEIAEGEVPVKALFLELNSFTEEFDKWYFNIFSYFFDGGTSEFEWLLDFDTDATYEEVFPLVDIDGVMEPFELFNILSQRQSVAQSIQDNHDWAEQLIITRAAELVSAAHNKAKEYDLEWADLPLYVSVKDYNFAVRTI
ncbi:MAG: hypothetical protein ACRC6V_14680 [Bacteroidales bacterium]